jgi:uncharacterized protein YicC (UPF0701 family)
MEIEQLIEQRLTELSSRVEDLSLRVTDMRENHLHHIELRLKEVETTLKIGWKAVVFGACVPAVISAALSIVQLIK